MEIPDRYKKELEIPLRILENVEKTHIGLGRLALFDVLSDIANRCTMIIGPSGSGKSVCTDVVYDMTERTKLKLDAITVSGLKKIQKALSNNTLTIVVDDLSKGQTEYSQIATVSVFSALCYAGSITKLTGQLELSIINFSGSALINLQPLLLKKIIKIPEFETDIRDKAIRYYHLRFPIQECLKRPSFDSMKITYPKEPKEVNGSKYFELALENFRYAFSKARAKEHLLAYLNASAELNKHPAINESDEWLIYQLTRCFRLEPVIFNKRDLEGSRYLNPNLIPLLTAISTYKKVQIKELVYRFGLSLKRLYEIINDLTEYVTIVKGKGLLIPTKTTIEILKEIGEWK